jgi:protein tyrosine/serine phosphatase
MAAMKRKIVLLILLLLGGATYLTWHYRLGPFSGNTVRDSALETRSGKTWAKSLDLPGLPNAHRVSDGLYRGAQPTAEGLASLRKLGVKTLISLRDDNDDTALPGSSDFKLVHIPLSALRNPKYPEVRRFMAVVSNPDNLPAFVHCRAGADRTGIMCAIYRIVQQGWDRQAALDEMIYGGFSFHREFQNLIKYIQTTDFEHFKQPATKPATLNDK